MIRLIFAGWKDNHTSGAVLGLQNNSAERSRRIALTQQNAFPELSVSLPHRVVRQVAF
ncbi:hypothetical protein [Leptospira noguchii]|uniref:hypothetical protein n=1 Tax=Leptospira noguchii TaxID=28182 RepID=UPI0012F9AE6D|nr:hypothetical protein [Leptospira noguchii]